MLCVLVGELGAHDRDQRKAALPPVKKARGPGPLVSNLGS
jgi:hypothetical protein